MNSDDETLRSDFDAITAQIKQRAVAVIDIHDNIALVASEKAEDRATSLETLRDRERLEYESVCAELKNALSMLAISLTFTENLTRVPCLILAICSSVRPIRSKHGLDLRRSISKMSILGRLPAEQLLFQHLQRS